MYSKSRVQNILELGWGVGNRSRPLKRVKTLRECRSAVAMRQTRKYKDVDSEILEIKFLFVSTVLAVYT